MRLKNWDKVEVHKPFPSFALNTNRLYILRHCIIIMLILQKNHINPLTFIF